MSIVHYEVIIIDHHGYTKKLRYYGNENILIDQINPENEKTHLVIPRQILENFLRIIKV